jgi:hypothetical protein
MLIQSAARGAVYEGDLGQSLVRVRTRQAGHKVADRERFWTNFGILEIQKVGQEDSVLVVVEPAYVGGVHGAEDCGRRILGMAGPEVDSEPVSSVWGTGGVIVTDVALVVVQVIVVVWPLFTARGLAVSVAIWG